MSIATRKAGTVTVCPRCANDILVPEQQPELDEQNSVQAGAFHTEFVQTESIRAEIAASESVTEPEGTEPGHAHAEGPPDSRPVQLASIAEDTDEDELDFELRQTSTDFDELDMTPMVDVTFLLLIFFMVTASFSIQKSIEVPPPDPDKQGAAQTVQPLEELEENSILIEIDEENRFFVESDPVNDPRDLPTILAEVRSKDSKNEVVVSVDERTHHEAVVTAIDAAQEVGMQRIRWGVNSSE